MIAEQRSLINVLAHSNQEYIRKFENLRLCIGGPPAGHVNDDASHNRAVEREPKTAPKSLSGVFNDNFEKTKSASDETLPQEEETTWAPLSKELASAPWSWPKPERHMNTAFINTGIRTMPTMPPVRDRRIPKTNAPMRFDQEPLLRQLEHCSMLITNLLKEVDEAQYKISFNSRLRMKGGIAGLLEGERRELEKTWGATALQTAEQRLDSLLEGLGELPRISKFAVSDRVNGLSDDNIMPKGESPSMAADELLSSFKTTGLEHSPEIPPLVQQPALKETDIIGVPQYRSSRSGSVPSLEHHLSEEKFAKPSVRAARGRLPLPSSGRKRKQEMEDMSILPDQPDVDSRSQSPTIQGPGPANSIIPPQGKDYSVIAPSNDLEWPLNQVLVWLAANKFSTDWQKTFESLNLCGAEFLALGRGSGGKGEIGAMHQAVYPRLARVCNESGTGWDQGKQREEGKRLRRSIRKLSRDLESPHAFFDDDDTPLPASSKITCSQDAGRKPLLQVAYGPLRIVTPKCHLSAADAIPQSIPINSRVNQNGGGGWGFKFHNSPMSSRRSYDASARPSSFHSNAISSSAEYMPAAMRAFGRGISRLLRASKRRYRKSLSTFSRPTKESAGDSDNGPPPQQEQSFYSASNAPFESSSNDSVATAATEGPMYSPQTGSKNSSMCSQDPDLTLDPLDLYAPGGNFFEASCQVEYEPGDSTSADTEVVDRLVSLWTTVKPP